MEREMATHSSALAWRIPGTVEPDGLPSVWSHRVGHDGGDLAAAAQRIERTEKERMEQKSSKKSSLKSGHPEDCMSYS